MASGPITSWQIERGKSGDSDRFYFLGLQNHYGQWLQPWNEKMLAPWKKHYENLDSILKSKNITLLTKVQIVKAVVFLVVMYRWEKAMAPHSSTLAWKIPWIEEPGGLQSMWSLRVGQDWATSLSLFTFMHWRRKWQSTLVFLPGESQGQRSLVGCRLWGRTKSNTTEAT